MKTNRTEKKYPNIEKAVAFEIDFVPLIYTYDSIAPIEFYREVCPRCRLYEQNTDYLAPKSSMKRGHGLLCSINAFAVCEEIKKGLVERFDVSEDDFRPVKSKKGDIVAYQIDPKRKMLPIDEVNRVRALKPCRKCGAVQYRLNEYKNKNGEPYLFATEELVASIGDLARTEERFDMYVPRIMVSRRVYEYLSNINPGMRFRPLFLKNSVEKALSNETSAP